MWFRRIRSSKPCGNPFNSNIPIPAPQKEENPFYLHKFIFEMSKNYSFGSKICIERLFWHWRCMWNLHLVVYCFFFSILYSKCRVKFHQGMYDRFVHSMFLLKVYIHRNSFFSYKSLITRLQNMLIGWLICEWSFV